MKPTHRSLAVGGIDTDAGKSVVTGSLARFLLDQGQDVTTLKLVQTGCTGLSEDILLHRRLMGQELSELDRDGSTCPYTFPFPASPALAARRTGQTIETAVLDQAIFKLQQQHDWLLIEGAGGLLVPLNERMLLLDFFAQHAFPLILVTTPRLGSINHTRLSLEAIKNRGMTLLGLVYNLHGDHPREIVYDTLQECRRALKAYGFDENLVLFPDLKESTAVGWQSIVTAAEHYLTS